MYIYIYIYIYIYKAGELIFEARDELNDSSWSVRRGSNENYLWLQSYDKNGIFIALHFYIFNILLHRNV